MFKLLLVMDGYGIDIAFAICSDLSETSKISKKW